MLLTSKDPLRGNHDPHVGRLDTGIEEMEVGTSEEWPSRERIYVPPEQSDSGGLSDERSNYIGSLFIG